MVKRDDAPDLTTLGGRIAYAMSELGLKPRALADRLGLKSTVAISQWRKNRRRPDPVSADKLARVFGVTTDWIYRGDGNPFTGPITADVPRSTYETPTPPLRGEALMDLVKDYGAKVDALRAQGGHQGKIEGMTEGLALAIRHMFMTDPDPDRMARTIAEILLSEDDPEEPPSGPHRIAQHSEARKPDEPRQQRRYRTAS